MGESAPTRLVVSGLGDPDAFRAAWAPSGASIERVGHRLHATSTIRALTRAAGRGLPPAAATDLIAQVQRAVDAWVGPAPPWHAGNHVITFDNECALMGILNVTPDSFSDGGLLYPHDHPDAAITTANRLLSEGARVLDVGGESTRPGSTDVDLDEELRRVIPVIQALSHIGGPVSVDTRKPEVARQAVKAGANIVNDVSAGRDDELLAVVAETGAGYVLMHSRGTPADMQQRTTYDDVVADVYEYLARGIDRCVQAGIERERIVVDPGIGFAKTVEQNLNLIGALRQFRGLGRPVLLGVSRKGFIGKVLGAEVPAQEDAAGRLEGSLACAALACQAGVAVLRVHDVAPTARVARMVAAIQMVAP